jgi:hypothetical protein
VLFLFSQEHVLCGLGLRVARKQRMKSSRILAQRATALFEDS